MMVGPSKVEIAGLYRGKRAEFLKWCKDPKQKRKGVIQMPSVGYLGDDKLGSIYDYLLASTKGKKEVVAKSGDRFRASPSARKRPLVQRMFMPDAGPAAIAVAVNEQFHYCWDAGACRLRYVWRGDFIDAWPVWRGNGDALAKVLGEVLLREAASPLPFAADAKRKFLGYRIEHGLPTFRYRVGATEVEERITPLANGKGLARRFVLRSAPGDTRLTFTASDKVTYRSDDGVFAGLVFTPAQGRRDAFTVIIEEKR